jgi:hypothetical protein
MQQLCNSFEVLCGMGSSRRGRVLFYTHVLFLYCYHRIEAYLERDKMSFPLELFEEINPWLTIILALTTVLGFVLMIVFYMKGKRERKPYYDIISFNLVQGLVNRVDSLEMFYSGELIENLTVTRVALWNGGRETINDRDIVSIDPPRARAKEGCKILSAQVLYATPTNQFGLEMAEDHSNVVFNFDYMDKDEGMVVQLFHTGISSRDVEVCGKIKGAGQITRVYVENPSISLRIFRCVFYLAVLIIGYAGFRRLAEVSRLLSLVPIFLSLLFVSYSVKETEVQRKRIPNDFTEYFDRLKFYWKFKDRKH